MKERSTENFWIPIHRTLTEKWMNGWERRKKRKHQSGGSSRGFSTQGLHSSKGPSPLFSFPLLLETDHESFLPKNIEGQRIDDASEDGVSEILSYREWKSRLCSGPEVRFFQVPWRRSSGPINSTSSIPTVRFPNFFSLPLAGEFQSEVFRQ